MTAIPTLRNGIGITRSLFETWLFMSPPTHCLSSISSIGRRPCGAGCLACLDQPLRPSRSRPSCPLGSAWTPADAPPGRKITRKRLRRQCRPLDVRFDARLASSAEAATTHGAKRTSDRSEVTSERGYFGARFITQQERGSTRHYGYVQEYVQQYVQAFQDHF